MFYKGLAFLASIVLVSHSVFASERMTIQEFVDSRIDGTTADKFEQLKKQHAAACDKWVAQSPFHVVQKEAVLSSNCAKAKFEKATVTKMEHSCWTEVHPVTGQSIEYCGEQSKTTHVGYVGRSVGTRELSFESAFERTEIELVGESFVGDKAKEKAWADFLVTCTSWLKDQQAAGAKLLFAGCRGAEKDTVVYSGKDGISRYDAKAVVLLAK